MGRRSFETRIRDNGRFPKGHDSGECECCDRPAVGWVRVAFSYMRGEDESYRTCDRHYNMALNNMGRFFAHYRTKDKHLASRSPLPSQQAQDAE